MNQKEWSKTPTKLYASYHPEHVNYLLNEIDLLLKRNKVLKERIEILETKIRRKKWELLEENQTSLKSLKPSWKR